MMTKKAQSRRLIAAKQLRDAARLVSEVGLAYGTRHDYDARVCALGAFEGRHAEAEGLAEAVAPFAVAALAKHIRAAGLVNVEWNDNVQDDSVVIAGWSNKIAETAATPKVGAKLVAAVMRRVAAALAKAKGR